MADTAQDAAGIGPLADDLAVAALAAARRFGGGGTMWCWSSGPAGHGHHVAVEFVHPVIVGKRALPAVVVDGGDAVSVLRPLVRSHDIILIVDAPWSDSGVRSALRRAKAWGALTIWIGAGERPEPGEADHVLWVGGDPELAGYDGRYVLLYHLLWELTHVCFEHPGLLHPPRDCDGPVCTTCSDEGRLAEVVRAVSMSATARTPDGLEEVDTSICGPLEPGDLILVHAGTALTIVDLPA